MLFVCGAVFRIMCGPMILVIKTIIEVVLWCCTECELKNFAACESAFLSAHAHSIVPFVAAGRGSFAT